MKRIPIYPVCAGLFAVLSLYASNFSSTQPGELIVPIICVVGGSLLLLGLLTLVTWSIHRGAIITTALVFCAMTYGHWLDALWRMFPPSNHAIQLDRLLMLCLQGAIVLTIAYQTMRIKNPHRWTRSLNWVGAIFLACPLAVIGWNLAQHAYRSMHPGLTPVAGAIVAPTTVGMPTNRPDIYFIVLDAHGRGDVLKDIYQYDDAPFLQHLRDKGFYVVQGSNSNYPSTELSLSSSLNLTYLDDMKGLDNDGTGPLLPRLRHNTLVPTLKSFGYRFVAMETAWPTLCFKWADDYLAPPPVRTTSQFQQLLIDTSVLPQLNDNGFKSIHSIRPLDALEAKRRTILYELQHAPEIADMKGPKFAFIHLFAPHIPFVFKADGSPTDPNDAGTTLDAGADTKITTEQYIRGYRDQATFIDREAARMVDQILARSSTPPIIILSSDHGPRSRVHWLHVDETDLHEVLSNLAAIYLPGKNNAGLYPTITPVNYFRVVLNDYFNANLPLLPDKMFFADSTFYNFQDVTDRVRPTAAPSEVAGVVKTADPPG